MSAGVVDVGGKLRRTLPRFGLAVLAKHDGTATRYLSLLPPSRPPPRTFLGLKFASNTFLQAPTYVCELPGPSLFLWAAKIGVRYRGVWAREFCLFKGGLLGGLQSNTIFAGLQVRCSNSARIALLTDCEFFLSAFRFGLCTRRTPPVLISAFNSPRHRRNTRLATAALLYLGSGRRGYQFRRASTSGASFTHLL